MSRKLKGQASTQRDVKNKSTLIFSWNVIKKAVLKHFPKVSYERLLVYLYDHLIARGNDFDAKMAYTSSEMNDKDNWLLFDRAAKRATLYVNDYKTNNVYGKQVIQLDKATTSLIMLLHPNNNMSKLFPMTHFNKFILDTFRAPPLLKPDNIDTKYLRHSIISTKLAMLNRFDKNYAFEAQKIADMAMHSVAQQRGTYLSPLKDANGNPIDQVEANVEEFETLIKDNNPEDFELTDADPYPVGTVLKVWFENPSTGRPQLYTGKVQFAHIDKDKVKQWHILFSDGDLTDYDEKEMKMLLTKKK
jgi:hypothetical protein